MTLQVRSCFGLARILPWAFRSHQQLIRPIYFALATVFVSEHSKFTFTIVRNLAILSLVLHRVGQHTAWP